MSIVASDAANRRVAPRFGIKLAAELAAGSALVPVTIHDLSSTGCGIEILTRDPDLADKIGATGLLQLQAVDRSVPGAVLPVMLRNMRFEGDVLRYGLEFRRLMPHQMRKLIGIMEALIPDDTADVTSVEPAPDHHAGLHLV